MKIRKDIKKIGDKWVELEVHYTAKHSSFTIKGLPEDFSTYSETWRKSYGTAASEGVLNDLLLISVREYTENKKSTRKVIAFSSCATPAIIMNRVSEGSYSGYKMESFKKMKSDKAGSLDYTVGFQFDVFTEVDSAGKKEYYRHSFNPDYTHNLTPGTYPKRIGNEHTIIPYSDEAIQFFVQMVRGFEKMVEKMSLFFGESDEEKILEFIKNTPLLIEQK